MANLCDGDARIALNGLQLAVQSQLAATKQQRKSNDNVPNSVSSPQQSGECSQNGKLPSNLNIDTEGFNEKKTVCVNVSHIKEGLQRTHLLYDRNGEEHYNIISAMHKSIRGSDENAALYWLARMLVGGEDPLYVARRLVRCASEDIGKCLLYSAFSLFIFLSGLVTHFLTCVHYLQIALELLSKVNSKRSCFQTEPANVCLVFVKQSK